MKQSLKSIGILFALFISATGVAAQNGKIVEQTSYKVPVGSYQEWLEGLKSRPPGDARDTAFDEQAFRRNNSPELFARLQKGEGVEGFKLKYLSDGLQVVGYLVKPKTVTGKLPVVIYNRGGHREFGRITLGTMLELASFAEAGFVVLASEYSGNGGVRSVVRAGARTVAQPAA